MNNQKMVARRLELPALGGLSIPYRARDGMVWSVSGLIISGAGRQSLWVSNPFFYLATPSAHPVEP